MRIAAMLATGLVVLGSTMPSFGESKEVDRACLDKVSKHLMAMGNLMKEARPKGECAIAKWVIAKHTEILKMYGTEPEECRKTELGKKTQGALMSIIRQETSRRKRSCR